MSEPEVRTVEEFIEKHYSPLINFHRAEVVEGDLKNMLRSIYDDFWKTVQEQGKGSGKLRIYELRDNKVWTCELGHFVVVNPNFEEMVMEQKDWDKIPCPTCTEIAKHVAASREVEENTCDICNGGNADYLPDVIRRNGDSGVWEHRVSKDHGLAAAGEGEYCLASKLHEHSVGGS